MTQDCPSSTISDSGHPYLRKTLVYLFRIYAHRTFSNGRFNNHLNHSITLVYAPFNSLPPLTCPETEDYETEDYETEVYET